MGAEIVWAKIGVFFALPMYCHMRNFSNCLICVSKIYGFFQKLFDNSLWICSLCIHLLLLGNCSVVAS